MQQAKMKRLTSEEQDQLAINTIRNHSNTSSRHSIDADWHGVPGIGRDQTPSSRHPRSSGDL
jgi:hypothetical protein